MKAWTIGHWNYSQQEFVSLLIEHDIDTLVDVRSFPGSRRSPQYGKERMEQWLPGSGINYVHLPAIGGRRRTQAIDNDVNAGWRLDSFHNYADYTLTPEWAEGMQTLCNLAGSGRVCFMCGEPMPWRCHRSIISNALVAQGYEIYHIVGNKIIEHVLGKWGPTPHVLENRVTYPLETV